MGGCLDGRVFCSYHRATFVPAPFQPLGRVDLHEAVFSRFTHSARRIQLAPYEPRWRQMFNLKRAILATTIPIKNKNITPRCYGSSLSIFLGDGTLEKQTINF